MSRVITCVLACVLLVACQDTPGVECDDGSLCPDGTTCRAIAGTDRCLSDTQLEQCDGKLDRTPCEASPGVAGLCNQGACLRAGCGDGFVSGTEQCDGLDLDGRQDCRDIGYYGEGVLGCKADCTFDQDGCSNLGKCGDGIINNTEQCDAADLGNNTCTTAGGYYMPDGLACNDACRFDFTACQGFCGDGVLDMGEECDRGASGPAQFATSSDNCQDLGYYRDVPITVCNNNCRVARTECIANAGYCGDGVADAEGDEECDTTDLGLVEASGDTAIDCRDLEAQAGRRYYQGALACRSNCTRDTSACQGFCGDGIKTGAEVCDRLDLGTAACGAYGGNLGCNSSCTAFTGACLGFYGDSIVNGNERCDTSNFAGLSCTNFGYNVSGSGELACASGVIVSDGCTTNGYCGDGIVQLGEQCDGADTAGNDCSSAAGAGPLDCDENCQFSTGTCQQAFWQRHTIPNPMGVRIDVLDGYSPNTSSLWLLSRNSDVWQWDGERWHERDLQNVPLPARAIGGLGDDVWVAAEAGAMTRLYRFTWMTPATGTWLPDAMLPQVDDLYSDGTTLWAATADGVWERAANGAWSKVVDGHYHAIDSRDGILMAAGQIVNGTNVARRDRDGTWERLALTLRDDGYKALRTISVISRDQAIVTQAGNPNPEGVEPFGATAYFWNGLEAWTLPLDNATGDTVAVGAYGGEDDDIWLLTASSDFANRRLALFHYTGYSDFEVVRAAPTTLPVSPPADYRFAKIIGSDPGNVWVLGDGAVAHYEGPGWHTAPTQTLRDLTVPGANPRTQQQQALQEVTFTAIASRGTATWVAGCKNNCQEAFIIEHRDEGIAIPNQPARGMGLRWDLQIPIDAMAIDDAGWVWAASGTTIQAVGNARGLLGPPPPSTTLPTPATAAYSLGARVVFGTSNNNQPQLVVHDPIGWTTIDTACATCTLPQLFSIDAIGASSPSDVWIASGDVIARWNGDLANPVWRIENDGASIMPSRVASMWVVNRHEAWQVRAEDMVPGVIVHVTWDDTGAQTARQITRDDGGGIGFVRGVWGSSSQDVWFANEGAEALHWDGARLSAFTLPQGGGRLISGTGPQDVWITGANGALMRLNQRLPATTSGACPAAIPIYCAEAPVTVRGSVGDTPVVYRLVSPLTIGSAKGSVTATVRPLTADSNATVEILQARAEALPTDDVPSMCLLPDVLGMATSRNVELHRGDWKYIHVRNQGVAASSTYELEIVCEQHQPLP